MVNAFLSISHFPSEWKEAIVNPLLKKVAKDSAYKNLRPVSNLQFVSMRRQYLTSCTPPLQISNELFPVLQKQVEIQTKLLQ